MKENYHLRLDKTLAELQEKGIRPTLLLHACCAPCSSYVLDYLCRYFKITLFYYNPNISPREEYDERYRELVRLVREMGLCDVSFADAEYEPEKFERIAKGLEHVAEGGSRCYKCYRLRLEESAKTAKQGGFDFFTTTLSISPYKNAQWLNEIGKELSEEYGVSYLFSDFKKKNGYRISCELSEKYSLYRQDFCGCVYSKNNKNNNKEES